jgi:hypothetical protein
LNEQQRLFAAKGIYSNWDRLGNIAATVDLLQAIKEQISSSIRSGYQLKNHKAVDSAALVRRIGDKSLELGLQMENFNRTHSGGKIPNLKATLSPRSWIKSKAPNSLPNLMFDGATIMSGSGQRTNGKQHSKQTKDYSNPPLCSSECAVHRLLSKQ